MPIRDGRTRRTDDVHNIPRSLVNSHAMYWRLITAACRWAIRGVGIHWVCLGISNSWTFGSRVVVFRRQQALCGIDSHLFFALSPAPLGIKGFIKDTVCQTKSDIKSRQKLLI